MSSSTRVSKFGTAKTIISTVGSIAAAGMVVHRIARELPPEFKDYLYLNIRSFINKFSTHLTMVIYESEGFQKNEIYPAAELYIASKVSPDIHCLKVTKNPNQKNIKVAVENNETFTDTYKGVKFDWSVVHKKIPKREYYDGTNYSLRSDIRLLQLTFHRDHKDMVLNEYLPFIVEGAKIKKQQQKNVKLFTLNTTQDSYISWISVNLEHPANFATLAMDTDIKEKVMKDLDRFVERRGYYRKVGKAWKRGYLLYVCVYRSYVRNCSENIQLTTINC